MKDRFIELWKRIGTKSDPETEFEVLKSMYSQPKRFYHNLRHIHSCILELDSVRELVQQPDLIEFAIWYHDTIYDAMVGDNEEKSAQLAYEVCSNSQIPEEFAEAVKGLILATKHDKIPEGLDARVFVDIDLSILGKTPQEFAEYEENIRREYSWVSKDKFREERRSILQAFLSRDTIYLTDFFRNKYEIQARKNLQKSVKALR